MTQAPAVVADLQDIILHKARQWFALWKPTVLDERTIRNIATLAASWKVSVDNIVDGYCLFYYIVAARDPRTWMQDRSPNGFQKHRGLE